MEQRFVFDTVASLYDAARPSYPEALFDDVIAEAGLKTGEAILEVGSGTGKATEALARRGFPVLALEPGAQMIAIAQKSLAGFSNVRFAETTFEAWNPDKHTFGLVAAAQSWHWVDPKISFAKAVRVLRPGGVLAVFGNVPMDFPEPFAEMFEKIYRRHLPEFVNTVPERGYLPGSLFAHMFEASGLLGPVKHKAYPWRWTLTAKSYTDYLGTLSHHRIMEPKIREAILSDTASAIDAHGGTIEIDFEAHLYMAHPK